MSRLRLILAVAAILTAAPAAHSEDLTPFSTFQDCDLCPEMIIIPPGEFLMGAGPADAAVPFVEHSIPGERPRHKVTIGYTFAIGKFEVTVAEFREYVEDTGAKTGGRCFIRLADSGPERSRYTGTPHPDSDRLTETPNLVVISDGTFGQPGLPVTDRHPAVCISRPEAEAYLAWLSSETARKYRLATEAEWEYATRAGTDTAFFWGNNMAGACTYANFADAASVYQAKVAAKCSEQPRPLWAAPAGSYAANPWGLHDTVGNVQEMLQDCWHENYAGAPVDGSPWMDAKCDHYIARGGDYELPNSSMRSAERLFYGIENGEFDRYNILGFRIAVSLSDTAWDSQ